MAGSTDTLTAQSGTEVLFFDLAEVEAADNVCLSVCTAQKHPNNPVLTPDDKSKWDSGWVAPWAIRGAIYDRDEEVFKIWYNGCQVGGGPTFAGYAISSDGVHWERPSLGLHESNGNKDNNIVSTENYGCIIKDYDESDPERRYKWMSGTAMKFSRDGIHWSEGWFRNGMELHQVHADPVALVRDDQDPDPDRRYKYVFQYYDTASKPGPEKIRFKGMAFSPDGLQWTCSRDNPILCPNDGFENENHFLAYAPYKGHWLLLYECAWYHPDGTGAFGRYTGDIRLAHSRDGEHFTRLNPHQQVIAKGNANEWDGQFLVITDKIVVKEDTIYLYYAGMGREWTDWPPGNQTSRTRLVDPKTGKAKIGAYAMRQIGLATLRLDGFTCMHVKDNMSLGSLTTRPIALEDAFRLTVNLGDTRPGWSWLEVEVLDADTGKPLPGFSRLECGPVTKDGVRVPVQWKDKGLDAVKAKAVRLRFHLYGAAKLYAFRFV